jgi:hypothetical protein
VLLQNCRNRSFRSVKNSLKFVQVLISHKAEVAGEAMIRKKSNGIEGEHEIDDGDYPSSATTTSSTPPQMSTREIVKLSFLLGLVDSSGDFDEYFLYLLLPLGYGCEDVNLIFSLLLLSKNICTWFNKPICGLLLDSSWASRRQHSTILISSSFFFFTALSLMYFGDSSSKPILVLLFLAHEFSTALLETNVWKVIKLRTQLIYGKKNVELQEQIISRIGQLFFHLSLSLSLSLSLFLSLSPSSHSHKSLGINNAMISDCLEMIALIVTYWICHSARSYLGATLFLGSVIIFSDFFILLISLTYNHSNMYSSTSPSSSSSSSSPSFTPLPSSPGRAIEMTKRNTLVMKSKEGELEEKEEEELEEEVGEELKTQKELEYLNKGW